MTKVVWNCFLFSFIVFAGVLMYKQHQDINALERRIEARENLVTQNSRDVQQVKHELDKYYDEIAEAYEEMSLKLMVIDLVIKQGLREYITEVEKQVKELENGR